MSLNIKQSLIYIGCFEGDPKALFKTNDSDEVDFIVAILELLNNVPVAIIILNTIARDVAEHIEDSMIERYPGINIKYLRFLSN